MDLSRSDAEALADALGELFGERVHVDGGEQRRLGDAELSIVEMGYTRHHRSSDGPSTTTHVRQTALISNDPELNLPQFALSPAPKGLAGRLLSLFGDMGDIDFDDSPQFSDAYHLHGWSEEPVRLLFSKPIRDHFAQHPQWSVLGKGKLLVVFLHDHVCDGAEREGFVEDALGILSLFQQAEERLDSMPDVRREATINDLASTAERTGGLAGAMLAKQLQKLSVTQEELDRFSAEFPPRSIPKGIGRQVIGENLIIVILGAVFTIAGLVGGSVIIATSEGIQRLFGLPFLVMFPLIGLPMMLLTIRHRSRKKRTLRRGAIESVRVTEVKGTESSLNDQRRYDVTVESADHGVTTEKTIHAYGASVDQARKFLSSGEPMRVLVDPKDPNHLIGIDLLMIFDQ